MARSPTAPPSDPPAARRRYAGLTADERRVARRERLLASALALFGEDGYASTSIEKLCAHAGVTARHFYEEFAGREDVLLVLYERILAEATQAVVEALVPASDEPRDRVERSVRAFLGSTLEDPRRARIACIEVVGVSPAMEKRRREAMRHFAALIASQAERLAANGHVPRRDFSLAALAMAGAGNELLVDGLWRDDRPDVETLARELVDLFVAVIRGAGA